MKTAFAVSGNSMAATLGSAAAFVLLGANDSVLRLESGKMAVPPDEVEKKLDLFYHRPQDFF